MSLGLIDKILAKLGSIFNFNDTTAGQWKDARDSAWMKFPDDNSGTTSGGRWHPVIDIKSVDYDYSIGVYQNDFIVSGVSDANYESGTNSTKMMRFDAADGTLSVDGKVFAQNNVLWTGGLYMTDGHTATLSQTVLNQPHGIVLAWSAYVNSAVANYDWVYTFVPKWHVTAHAGNGIDCNMRTVTNGKVGGKYVYVYNDKITGAANNTATGTASGITYANNYWVLRAVIGV